MLPAGAKEIVVIQSKTGRKLVLPVHRELTIAISRLPQNTRRCHDACERTWPPAQTTWRSLRAAAVDYSHATIWSSLTDNENLRR
jgi:hypothetical protein